MSHATTHMTNLFAALDVYRTAVRGSLDSIGTANQEETNKALEFAKERVVAVAFAVEGMERSDCLRT